MTNIQVIFNREASKAWQKKQAGQRWNVTGRVLKRGYTNISNSSVQRLLKMAIEYGYTFQML